MEPTVLLAKIFGVYLIIVAIAVFINRKALMVGVMGMFKERFAQLMTGILAVLGGLFLINIHNDWSSLPSTVVSLIGWLTFIKGLFLLFLPERHLAEVAKMFKERVWYTIDGVLALALGLYLTGFGYGFW